MPEDDEHEDDEDEDDEEGGGESNPNAQSDSEEISSSDDESDKVDLDEAEIKLAQMRRTAVAKRGLGKGASLASKFSGLQSFEEMQREHSLQRMTEGVRQILQLHTPYELSSICGFLQLPVKEKASTSLNLIVSHVTADGVLSSAKLKRLLDGLWEGALWEYLRVIGHPSSTMFLDPKKTVMKIWEQGGVLAGEGSFVPHFLVREVKKRYTWIRGEDILARLEKLRVLTEKCKRAELDMVSSHDFTNIVNYLRLMNELRGAEEKCREYIIGELDNCRAKLDTVDNTLRMSREDMADLERQLVVVTDALNEKFAYVEFAAERNSEMLERKETEMHRLLLVMESFLNAQRDRDTVGGGGIQALKLREMKDCSSITKRLYDRMVEYRTLRDDTDDKLRDRVRGDIDEITRLETRLRELEEQAESEMRRANFHELRAERAEDDVRLLLRKLMLQSLDVEARAGGAWESSISWMQRALDAENRIRRSQRFVAACVLSVDKDIHRLGMQLNQNLQAFSGQEKSELDERLAMFKADILGKKHRLYLKDLEDAKKRGSKPKKTVVSSGTQEKKVKVDDEESTAAQSKASSKASKGSKGGKGKKAGGDKKKAGGDKKAGGVDKKKKK